MRHRRIGFTLVELLVVIAIIGILVALLLPAVQAAREAARRMQCGNNLKQVATALHNYHDTYKTFPMGFSYPSNDGAAATPTDHECWAWSALMLPFIEQSPLHDAMGVTQQNLWRHFITAGAATKQRVETTIPTFVCPSDSGYNQPGKIHANRHFNDGIGVTTGGVATPVWPGLSNYMGNAGHRSNAALNPNTGIFYGNSNVRIADIMDGTSTTILVGERDTFYCRSGTWAGVRNPQGAQSRGVYVVAAHSHPVINQDTNVIAWNTNDIGCGQGYSSLHPGGIQVALCDASVRFVSETIHQNWYGTTVNGTVADSKDPSNGTYQRLMTRDDTQPVGDY